MNENITNNITNNNESEEIDKWELDMQTKINILNNCQSSKNFDSCMGCEEIFNCNIRDNYVNSVYSSMSKGSTGGFEF